MASKRKNRLVAGTYKFDLEANGVYELPPVTDFKSDILTATSYVDAFQGRIRFMVSTQDDVDFSSAPSATNRWDYCSFYLIGTGYNGDVVLGDSGGFLTVPVTSTYTSKLAIGQYARFAFEVSSYATGCFTVELLLTDNY